MGKELDPIIKIALQDEAKEVSGTEDFFHKIRQGLETDPGRHPRFSAGFGWKRRLSLAASVFVICTALLLTVSPQARVYAGQTLSSIKTIFVLEREGDKLHVVEKPANEAKFIRSVAWVTTLSDEELDKKLGFKVGIPERLADSFTLKYKTLGVTLVKEVDYETGTKLQDEMFKAIEDDNALERLKPYNAVRDILVKYERPDQTALLINVSRAKTLSEVEAQMKEYENTEGFAFQKVKVGDLDGYWVNTPASQYPATVEKGIGQTDVSAQPEIRKKSALIWEKSGFLYSLTASEKTSLSMEECLNLAGEFIKSN